MADINQAWALQCVKFIGDHLSSSSRNVRISKNKKTKKKKKNKRGKKNVKKTTNKHLLTANMTETLEQNQTQQLRKKMCKVTRQQRRQNAIKGLMEVIR